jgi:RNA polymerase sigma-70 factor (ECF subfamily)
VTRSYNAETGGPMDDIRLSPSVSIEQLESFRSYLCAVAEREIDPRWRARLAASDLVQQTLIEAAQALPHAELQDQRDIARWLRRILANNMCDNVRRLTSARRDIGREVTTGKSAMLRLLPVQPGDCPESQAITREESQSLDLAIAQLSAMHQQVILWRHRENRSFAQIAEMLGISENAAQKRWSRAIDALREQLKETQ